MGLSVYLWLYYSAFSLAWFLVGYMTHLYVSTNMKHHDVGIMARIRRAVMARGTVTTVDSNSPYKHGVELEEWDFPILPRNVSRFIAGIDSIFQRGHSVRIGPIALEPAIFPEQMFEITGYDLYLSKKYGNDSLCI